MSLVASLVVVLYSAMMYSFELTMICMNNNLYRFGVSKKQQMTNSFCKIIGVALRNNRNSCLVPYGLHFLVMPK